MKLHKKNIARTKIRVGLVDKILRTCPMPSRFLAAHVTKLGGKIILYSDPGEGLSMGGHLPEMIFSRFIKIKFEAARQHGS
jgi:hypothetical protein